MFFVFLVPSGSFAFFEVSCRASFLFLSTPPKVCFQNIEAQNKTHIFLYPFKMRTVTSTKVRMGKASAHRTAQLIPHCIVRVRGAFPASSTASGQLVGQHPRELWACVVRSPIAREKWASSTSKSVRSAFSRGQSRGGSVTTGGSVIAAAGVDTRWVSSR